ncbi:MAG: hypothetical protein HW406_252 [Candidatus Brocadiaceae bacterium]|nr:hypothetical protein [Candidatus Brocadiaceae bacterium]
MKINYLKIEAEPLLRNPITTKQLFSAVSLMFALEYKLVSVSWHYLDGHVILNCLLVFAQTTFQWPKALQ